MSYSSIERIEARNLARSRSMTPISDQFERRIRGSADSYEEMVEKAYKPARFMVRSASVAGLQNYARPRWGTDDYGLTRTSTYVVPHGLTRTTSSMTNYYPRYESYLLSGDRYTPPDLKKRDLFTSSHVTSWTLPIYKYLYAPTYAYADTPKTYSSGFANFRFRTYDPCVPASVRRIHSNRGYHTYFAGEISYLQAATDAAEQQYRRALIRALPPSRWYNSDYQWRASGYKPEHYRYLKSLWV